MFHLVIEGRTPIYTRNAKLQWLHYIQHKRHCFVSLLKCDIYTMWNSEVYSPERERNNRMCATLRRASWQILWHGVDYIQLFGDQLPIGYIHVVLGKSCVGTYKCSVLLYKSIIDLENVPCITALSVSCPKWVFFKTFLIKCFVSWVLCTIYVNPCKWSFISVRYDLLMFSLLCITVL